MEEPRVSPPSRVERLIGPLVDFLERHPWPVVLFSTLIAALSVWATMNLRVVQDLKILLPPDAPAITRLETLEARMGNLNDLFIEIKSPSRDANLAYGAALAARLEARSDIRFALFHQDRAFFEDHALLYVGVGDLLDLRQRVIDRIKQEVSANLDSGFEDEDAAAPTPPPKVADELGDLSADELKKRYGIDEKLPEYFEADEGRVVVIKARPTRGTTDPAFNKALLEGVAADIAAAAPERFHPELKVSVEGAYVKRQKDVNSVAGDAASGTTVAAILLILSVGLYFRRVRAVPLIIVPLFLSVILALGYAYLRYGFLNLVSAFIFAVLLGVGIDFGLHVLSRYEFERTRGHGRPEALKIVLATTGMSTLTGAASTVGVYAVLMLADFQGFAQFGELAAVGVTAAALAVFTVLPAFLILFERRFPWRPHRGQRARIDAPPVAAGPPTRRMVTAAAVALGIGGAWAATSAIFAPDIAFEYDFRKLGPKPSATADAAPAADEAGYEDAVGKVNTLGPVVALTRSLDETRAVHRTLSAVMDLTEDQAQRFSEVRAGTYAPPAAPAPAPAPAPATPPPAPAAAAQEDEDDGWDDEEPQDDPVFVKLRASLAEGGQLDPDRLALLAAYGDARVLSMHRSLVQVFSVWSFVPDRQEDKLTIVRDIRRRIDAKRAKLSEDTQKKLADVERFLKVDAPVGVDDLPAWVKVQFTDEDGKLGHFVIFRNRGSMSDYRVSEEIHRSFFDLPTEHGPVPTAGNAYIMPEMLDTVGRDAPVVLILALLVVLVTAWALFRTAFGVGVVALTVVLAVLWLVGVMEVLDWKANFFNIIAIPLLLGMGQDYSVHLYHRYLHDGVGQMRLILHETGGVLFMTTLTTIIGFGGILFANHQGLLSMAWTSVIGLAFCLIAAVVILPSILVLLGHRRARREALRRAA